MLFTLPVWGWVIVVLLSICLYILIAAWSYRTLRLWAPGLDDGNEEAYMVTAVLWIIITPFSAMILCGCWLGDQTVFVFKKKEDEADNIDK